MIPGWWLLPGVVLGGSVWAGVTWVFGFEPTLWVVGALAAVAAFRFFGARAASTIGLAMIVALALRRERKAEYDQREAERAREALDQIKRGSRARDRLDLSDERLRDDDGYRRD